MLIGRALVAVNRDALVDDISVQVEFLAERFHDQLLEVAAEEEQPILVGEDDHVLFAAAVAGVFLLTSDGGSSSGSGSLSAASTAGPNLGDLLCVLSAVLFGVHKWRSEQLVEGLSGGVGGGGGAGEAAAAAPAAKTEGRDSAGESSSSSSSSSKNEETVRSLVALQLCVLAVASVALCVPEAASAVREALADQRSVFDLASSSSASSAVGGVDFYAAVARQLWSEFAGLPWALFAYMGLFT